VSKENIKVNVRKTSQKESRRRRLRKPQIELKGQGYYHLAQEEKRLSRSGKEGKVRISSRGARPTESQPHSCHKDGKKKIDQLDDDSGVGGTGRQALPGQSIVLTLSGGGEIGSEVLNQRRHRAAKGGSVPVSKASCAESKG